MGDTWRVHWLHPLMGTTTRDTEAPLAYMAALRHVAVTLDGDPAWQSWWQGSGVPECQLGIVAEGRPDHRRSSADIRKAGNKVRANFTCALPAECGQPNELFPLAVDEVTAMFAVIREAIGLAALPALPALPELPADACEVAVTAKPLPPVLRDVEQQGYLTLAQIQEFFA